MAEFCQYLCENWKFYASDDCVVLTFREIKGLLLFHNRQLVILGDPVVFSCIFRPELQIPYT